VRHSATQLAAYPGFTMTRTRILAAALLIAFVATSAASAVSAARAATPKLPLSTVGLGDPTIAGHLFLGRTPTQVTSAFGNPSARTQTKTAAALRYGTWTISFKRRASDGKLIAYAARANGGTLTGVRGHRLLAPAYSASQIKEAVAAEVEYVVDGDFNEWMPRGAASFFGLDFPRTISWGVDRHNIRWIQSRPT
jgi:hypothetical protein